MQISTSGHDDLAEILQHRSVPGSGSSTSTPNSKSGGHGTNQASAGSPPTAQHQTPMHTNLQGEDQEIFNTCNSGSENDDGPHQEIEGQEEEAKSQQAVDLIAE